MASPVDTSVKFFHSAMPGAPAASGVVGSLIAILDACLVDGWGSKTLTSLAVSGGIATATFSGGVGPFETDSVVLIAGVTGGLTALNGEQKVLSASATQVTFATAASDGTASGTITMKIAPAGWTKQYTGTNKAVYKSSDPAATGMLLRVDHNTQAARAELRGYETMSDVDTGTNRFPSSAQNGAGLWLHTNYQAGASTNPWLVIADSRIFYIGIALYSANNVAQYNMREAAFGDFLSDKSPDPYAALLCAPSDTPTSNIGKLSKTSTAFATSVHSAAPREYNGIGSSVPLARLLSALELNDYESGSASNFGGAYPNPTNNGLILTKLGLHSGSAGNHWRRGQVPGMYYMLQNSRAAFVSRDTVAGNGPLAGRKLMAMKVGDGQAVMPNVAQAGTIFFDITGPWR